MELELEREQELERAGFRVETGDSYAYDYRRVCRGDYFHDLHGGVVGAMNYKPFNLEAAQAGDPIITGDGCPAKFAGYNPEAGEFHKVGAWVTRKDGTIMMLSYSADGRYNSMSIKESDLFMAPKVKEVWVMLSTFCGENGQLERITCSCESENDVLEAATEMKRYRPGTQCFIHKFEIPL